jgi:hypothetical protein
MSENSSHRDAEIIDLCRRKIERERALALCAQDAWAPDKGPNQQWYKALGVERNAAVGVLVQFGPPAAPEDVSALARCAMRIVVRNYCGELPAANSHCDWLLLVVVTAVLGQPGAVPLREIMPSGCAVTCPREQTA